MARSSANYGYGWDFVKDGGVYQYKEGGYVAIVKVWVDHSTDTQYEFHLMILAENHECGQKEIILIARKGITGTYNDAAQLYEEPEYIMLPIGKPYPHEYDKKAVRSFLAKSMGAKHA